MQILADSNIKIKTVIKADTVLQVFTVGKLDLGNNFTYDHFIDSLKLVQIIDIFNMVCGDIIRLSGQGNYGKVMLNTNDFDLGCYLKEKYDRIEWDMEAQEYYLR